MSQCTIIPESSNEGRWYCIYYRGRFVDGFRSHDDAIWFAKWYADSDKTSAYGEPSGLVGLDSEP